MEAAANRREAMRRGYIIEVTLNGEKMYYQSLDSSCFVDDPLKAERFRTKAEAKENCSSGSEVILAV